MYVALFRFPDDQSLVAFTRYMDTIFIAMGALLFGELFNRLEYSVAHDRKRKNVEIMIGTLCALGVFSSLTIYNNARDVYNSNQNSFEFRKWTQDKIEMEEVKTMDPYKDKVYLVSQKNNQPVSSSFYQAKFIMAPIPTNRDFSSNGSGNYGLSYYLSANESDDPYKTNYTIDEWQDALEDYTYLLVLNFDDDFVVSYEDMFRDEIQLGLYTISDGYFEKVA